MRHSPSGSSSTNSGSRRAPQGTGATDVEGSARMSSSSSSSRAPVGAAMPLHFAPPQMQQPAQPPSLPLSSTNPVRNPAGSSSSPPTPSSLSTSGSDANRRRASAVAQLPLQRSAALATSTSAAGQGRRTTGQSGRVGAVSSASIHAAAAAATTSSASLTGGSAPQLTTLASAAAAGTTFVPPISVVGGGGISAQTLSSTLPSEEDTAAATARETQRQQILGHANDLLRFCAISNKVTSIRECTSSFFVLLYQRLFDCPIAGIDSPPNTAEKRRHNVALMLEQLRKHPYPLENIEAEEVVKLNEDHISRLIMVFVQIAEDMRRQQHVQQLQAALAAASAPYPDAARGAANAAVAAVTAAPSAGQPVTSGSAAAAAAAGEDYGVGRTSSGAYVPVGYTVAEVMPPSSAVPLAHPQQQLPPPPPQQLSAHHPNQRHGMHEFYVAHGAGAGAGLADPAGLAYRQQAMAAMDAGTPYRDEGDEEESPSSGSYYEDASVPPTDNLLEEWYRNLVYPPPHAPGDGDDGSAMLNSTATHPSFATGGGGMSPTFAVPGRPDRSDHEYVTSAASSSGAPTPAHIASAAAALAGVGTAPRGAGQASKPAGGGGAAALQRAQLNAHDIVRRCQRLGEALDAQEERQRQQPPHMRVSPVTKTSANAGAAVGPGVERHASTRPHQRGGGTGAQQDQARDGRMREEAASRATPVPTSDRVRDRMEEAGEDEEDERVPVGHMHTPHQGFPSRPSRASPAALHPHVSAQHQQLRRPPPTAMQQQQQHRQPPPTAALRAPHHRFVAEPPLTRQERDFLVHRPQQRSEAAERDSKIERLRAARYLGEMQQLLRQRMRREYDAQMTEMRGSLKESMQQNKREKMALMRRVRDENERYRAAFATLMEAAANEAQVPARVMSRHTAQLADYYATSLQHSHAMCESLEREADRRTKTELLQYAEEVSGWQQHFLL